MKDLTIREYANLKGVSVQSIYQRLDHDLKPYLKLINGKKYLDREVLELDKEEEQEKAKQETNKQSEELINILKSQIEILNGQLITKDEQIRDLNKRLEEMSQRLRESNQLNQNNQVLLLETHKNSKKGLWNFFKGKQDQDQETNEE